MDFVLFMLATENGWEILPIELFINEQKIKNKNQKSEKNKTIICAFSSLGICTNNSIVGAESFG